MYPFASVGLLSVGVTMKVLVGAVRVCWFGFQFSPLGLFSLPVHVDMELADGLRGFFWVVV